MTASLWEFSLEAYGRPGVQAACLNFQEEMGADVNILLYCCWRGAMQAGEIENLTAKLASWQRDIIGALRKVRRRMKPMVKELAEQSDSAAQLRKKIAEVELEAEKLQQSIMMRFAVSQRTKSPPSPHAAAQNLALYFQSLQKPTDSAALNALRIILGGAYPESDDDTINDAINDIEYLVSTYNN